MARPRGALKRAPLRRSPGRKVHWTFRISRLTPDQDGLFLLVRDLPQCNAKRAAAAALFFCASGSRVVPTTNKLGGTMRAFLLATALVLTPVAAFADLAISGQDGKQVRAGDGLPMTPTPDSVATIAFSSTEAPKVIGVLKVCSTQMGPPSALAVAPDYSFVLATCPQKIGPDNKTSPENLVSVIGLDDPTHPKLLQQVQAGMGATGIYLDKKARFALVTGVGDDTITMFTIKDRQLTQTAQIKLEAKAEPRDVLISPDGRFAYALRFGDGKVTKLAIKGDQLSRVADYDLGVNPDGGSLTHDGRYLIVNNFS